jgi:hypothetical protein
MTGVHMCRLGPAHRRGRDGCLRLVVAAVLHQRAVPLARGGAGVPNGPAGAASTGTSPHAHGALCRRGACVVRGPHAMAGILGRGVVVRRRPVAGKAGGGCVVAATGTWALQLPVATVGRP